MNKLSTLAGCILAFVLLTSSNSEKGYYSELYRPQFHFTSEINWLGEPDGLIYYEGEYNMFYQYNPNGKNQSFMHWGHAASQDLIHWQSLPIAIYPDENSQDSVYCTAFSGSAIVDENNLLGKQAGTEKTLVAFYTSQHCGQRIAYSTDKGMTWEKYEGNPVIPYDPIDDANGPKVFWYEPTKKWVMALYRKTSEDDRTRGISFYTSDNLVNWEWKSHIPGFYDRPDFFKLKVTNRPEEEKWVLFEGDGSYILGSFDGEVFTPESAKIKGDLGSNYYAPQTWTNISPEDGRTIQIAWMKGGNFPDMPFNGQLTFPCELSLTKFSFGYKIVKKPVEEISMLHGKHYDWENKKLIPGINQNILSKLKGDCFHIIGEFDIKNSDSFGFYIRKGRSSSGTEIMYNVKRGTLDVLGKSIPVVANDNKISLEILVDKTSIEIFANGGQTVISNCFTPDPKSHEYSLVNNGGEIEVIKMDVYEMKSAWEE